MIDTNWIRAYNNKHILTGGEIRSGSTVRAPSFMDLDNGNFQLDPASTSNLNRVDASIMYDRDNTGYYSDPASTNRLNAIDSNSILVRGAITSPEGTLRDDNGGWIRTYGNTGWYSQTYGGGWYMEDNSWIRAYNNKNILTNGEIRSGSVMRAPYFLDLNDGNYYVDPNGVSYTSRIRSAGGSSPAYNDELVTKSYVDSRPGGATAIASGTIGWSCGRQMVYPGVGIRDTNSYVVGVRIAGGWGGYVNHNGEVSATAGQIIKQWGYTSSNTWYERVAFPIDMGCSGSISSYPSGVNWVLYRVNN